MARPDVAELPGWQRISSRARLPLRAAPIAPHRQSSHTARMTGRHLPIALFLCFALTTRCGSTPTAPDNRYGSPLILVRCETGSASALNCTAPVGCSLYPCQPGTPADITATATWTTDDPSVAKVTGPGILVPVGPGNTVVRAATSGVGGGSHSVAVFTGTAPLPTFGLQGTVHEGATPNDVKIDGATIQVIDGLIAGRIATSGAPPAGIPGFSSPPTRPGLFIINGVPPGTIRLRVRKEGYVPVERDVTSTFAGGPGNVDFQLQRQ